MEKEPSVVIGICVCSQAVCSLYQQSSTCDFAHIHTSDSHEILVFGLAQTWFQTLGFEASVLTRHPVAPGSAHSHLSMVPGTSVGCSGGTGPPCLVSVH